MFGVDFEKMSKVKVILEDVDGDVQELTGNGIVFSLVTYEDSKEDEIVTVGMQAGVFGHYPPEVLANAQKSIDSTITEVLEDKTIGELEELLDLLKSLKK